MHDFSGGELDEHKGEERADEQVVGLHEVARPDVTSVVSQESRPPLSPRGARSRSTHVFLDRAFAHLDAKFEQFSADPFRAPESVLGGHRPDQGDRFGSEARHRAWTGAPSPESLEPGAVPAKKRLGLNDPQDVPPGWRQGGKRDQGDSVEPSLSSPLT